MNATRFCRGPASNGGAPTLHFYTFAANFAPGALLHFCSRFAKLLRYPHPMTIT